MKIIDISKCNEDVITYINKLQNNYFELEKLYKEKDKEIERLNNIINKFENSLIESDKYINNSIFKEQLKYLQELKGSDK